MPGGEEDLGGVGGGENVIRIYFVKNIFEYIMLVYISTTNYTHQKQYSCLIRLGNCGRCTIFNVTCRAKIHLTS